MAIRPYWLASGPKIARTWGSPWWTRTNSLSLSWIWTSVIFPSTRGRIISPIIIFRSTPWASSTRCPEMREFSCAPNLSCLLVSCPSTCSLALLALTSRLTFWIFPRKISLARMALLAMSRVRRELLFSSMEVSTCLINLWRQYSSIIRRPTFLPQLSGLRILPRRISECKSSSASSAALFRGSVVRLVMAISMRIC